MVFSASSRHLRRTLCQGESILHAFTLDKNVPHHLVLSLPLAMQPHEPNVCATAVYLIKDLLYRGTRINWESRGNMTAVRGRMLLRD